jgi:hypothetical protein
LGIFSFLLALAGFHNSWIDKITTEWSGAIPMTLIVNKNRNIRHFIGKSVQAGELETLITSFNL